MTGVMPRAAGRLTTLGSRMPMLTPTRALGSAGRSFEVVLVSYRSRDHVAALLASWPTEQPVAVVDNSRNMDGIIDLVARYPRCRLVDGRGQGFARAANMGAFSSGHPYVVFVNPDARPAIEDLRELVEALAQDVRAASCAATVVGSDGAPEIGVGGWEPTVRRALVHGFGLHKLFPRAGLYAKPAPGDDTRPDWTTGACMAVPTALFRLLGGFDERFYVYSEDVSYGRTARYAGLHQLLRTDVLVPHGAGRSGAPSEEMLRLRGASFANYLVSYHPAPRVAGVVAATVAGYALRAAVAFPRQRELARGYVAFILGLLTRRATVGGVEVAQARFRAVAASPAHTDRTHHKHGDRRPPRMEPEGSG